MVAGGMDLGWLVPSLTVHKVATESFIRGRRPNQHIVGVGLASGASGASDGQEPRSTCQKFTSIKCPGSQLSLQAPPLPLGPFSVAGPLSEAQFLNMGSRKWALFLGVGPLVGVKKKT